MVVRGPPAGGFAAAALALAVALSMRVAERGQEEAGEHGEDDDEEEVVVLGDAGRAAMQAGAALRAAAAFATATTGRFEGISSGCGFAAGGWRGPAATWRPAGPSWSSVMRGGGVGLRSLPSEFSRAGLLQCGRACTRASAGGNSSRGLHSGVKGLGSGVAGLCVGALLGHRAGWACRGGWGSWWWVCEDCQVSGAARLAWRGGLRRAFWPGGRARVAGPGVVRVDGWWLA